MSRPPGVTYANGSPYQPLPYPKPPRLLGCPDGAHLTRGTTDRDGAVVHVCTRACGAYRVQGDPAWRTP